MNGCVQKLKRAIGFACVVVGIAATAEAGAVTLVWAPNSEPDIGGYRVSYGTTSGQYTSTVDVGNTTTHTFNNLLSGYTYYFAVQAYNPAGTSPYSNEVSATLASALSVTNLAANSPSPQPAGTTISFSATAAGGSPPYQYKWWIVTGTTQTVGSNWSTNNSFAWTPTLANPSYAIRVWARNASSTADAPDNPAATLQMSFAITSSVTVNLAPIVNAGADQTITLPASATLTATVTDDGLPAGGSLTRSWTRVSGPGTVTFSAPTSATTSASFSAAGSYVLRLTVSDGALSVSDDVAIVVNPAAASGSLVGAWGFNEGTGAVLGDSSGNGRTGAVTGATWTTGKFGKALNFGGNDVVTLSDLDLAGPFTVMAWMQTRSLYASGCGSLVMKARDYGFEICQGRLYAGVGIGSSWTAHPSQALTSADLNVWKHVALTYDGTTLRFYVGGALITSVVGVHGTSNRLLRFGSWNTNSEFWNGLIDEVRIYSRALTAAEVQTDMNTPVGGVSANQPPTLVNPGNQTHAEGTVVSLPLSASDPDGDQIAFSATGLPPGLAINSSTGVISGTLSFTSAGTYASSATATAGGQSNTKSFTWTVTDTSTNQAPIVNAGADQTITLPEGASLSATVSDDGLPSGTLTRSWTRVSGPGTVTFSAPTSATTSASFSAAGSYVLRLTVSDGALNRSDDVAIIVNAPALSGSLVGAWGFNEGAGSVLGDSSGNGRTGAVTGATWTTGKYGKALNFDGNDFVTLSDLDLPGSFTVMAWMQARSLYASGCGSLVMKARDYGFEICGGRLYAGVGIGSSWTAHPSQTLTSADLNVWKHVALTYDGTTLRFYIGGTLITSVAGTHVPSNNLLLFGRWNTNSEFWNGLIDEVRIYNRTLSQAEVQVDMNTPIGN